MKGKLLLFKRECKRQYKNKLRLDFVVLCCLGTFDTISDTISVESSTSSLGIDSWVNYYTVIVNNLAITNGSLHISVYLIY